MNHASVLPVRALTALLLLLVGTSLLAQPLAKVSLDQSLVESAKLLAANGTDEDQFGESVDIDGDLAIVGGNFRDNPDGSRGVVFIFRRTGPGQWQRVTRLEPGSEAMNRKFGASVAIDGDIAVVGAADNFPNFFGAVFFFHRNAGGPDNWGLEAFHERTSFAERQSFLGLDVDVSGDQAIAGAQRFPGGGTALLFQRTGPGAWTNRQLMPSIETQFFGSGVAIEGDLAVVGARNNNSGESGTVHFFRRDFPTADAWGEVQVVAVPVEESLGSQVAVGEDLAVASSPSCTTGVDSEVFLFRRDRGGAENWGLEQRITESGCNVSESLAIEGDRLFVGDSVTTIAPGAGHVQVFQRNAGGPDGWGLVQELIPANAAGGDHFGISVGIDAGRLIVGARGDDENGGSFAGAAFVFEAGPTTGEEDLDGVLAPAAGDRLGSAVAVQGNLVIIGTPGDDSSAADAGRVEILRREGDGFVPEATLTAPTPRAGENFGAALAFSDDVLVIGAPALAVAKGAGSGLQAYVFQRLNQEWTYKQALPSDVSSGDDGFGAAITLDGDLLVVGAPADADGTGAVQLFDFDGSNWNTVDRQGPAAGQPGDRFGAALALKQGTLLAGAPGSQIGGQLTGSAAMFDVVAGNLQPLGTISGSESGAGAAFGSAVAFDGTTMAIGAPGENADTGAVYRFGFTGSSASEQARISPDDAGSGARFGSAVALSGDRLAVGASGGPATSGRGYLFGIFSGERILGAARDAPTAGDAFGNATAIDGETLLFGAPGVDAEAGAASVIFDTERLFVGDFE